MASVIQKINVQEKDKHIDFIKPTLIRSTNEHYIPNKFYDLKLKIELGNIFFKM